jgi:hypothetical protein
MGVCSGSGTNPQTEIRNKFESDKRSKFQTGSRGWAVMAFVGKEWQHPWRVGKLFHCPPKFVFCSRFFSSLALQAGIAECDRVLMVTFEAVHGGPPWVGA